MHSRCDDCAKYGKYRRLHQNDAELEAVTKAYNRHIEEVFADRQILTSMENAVDKP